MEIDKNIILDMADKYNLMVNKFEPMEGGAAHSSYLLYTDRCNYVLTVFSIGLDRVIRLGELLVLLAECEFPTTRLLHTAKGDIITTHKEKPVMLKRYITGRVCQDLNGTMLSQIGATMAELNNLPVPDYLPDEHAYGLQYFSSIIGQNVNLEYESWLAKRFTYLNECISSELPRGLIHGDVFYNNVLFEGEKFRAIIDFEEACYYYKVFDLGMGIIGLCIEGTTLMLDKAKALVAGYQRIRILEESEKRALQLFVEYAAVATSSWRFWKYNIDDPLANKLRNYSQMVIIADKVASIPKANFIEAIFS